jgi:hypothetical protein
MANTHRYEARIAERSVNLLGLQGGAVVDVQDSFRSPKAHMLKRTRDHACSGKCTRALTFENFEFLVIPASHTGNLVLLSRCFRQG